MADGRESRVSATKPDWCHLAIWFHEILYLFTIQHCVQRGVYDVSIGCGITIASQH